VADSPSTDPKVVEGFTRVDDQPEVAFLVNTMDATADWPAVRRLRAWELERIAPITGDRILDVGCGLGDVLTPLAAVVGPTGRLVGIDASEAFLAVARQRAEAEGASVDYRTGDATALELDDRSFDICRSERMLQWLPDLAPAVAEMVRVLRPGGRLCVTDTDWRTLQFDVVDEEALQAVSAALRALRTAGFAAGARLLNVCRDLGLVDIECRADTHVWTEWDADHEDGRAGFFPLGGTIMQLVDQGRLDGALARRFLDEVYAAARADRYYMSLSMTAVFARRSA
jgi:SAM-dependent methyltransferase